MGRKETTKEIQINMVVDNDILEKKEGILHNEMFYCIQRRNVSRIMNKGTNARRDEPISKQHQLKTWLNVLFH